MQSSQKETVITEECFGKVVRTTLSFDLQKLKPFWLAGCKLCPSWHVVTLQTYCLMSRNIQFDGAEKN